MAAVLKKRALAEFTQTQVIQNTQQPIKKLRLVRKPTTESTALALISCLESAKSSNEALHTLLRISDAFDFDPSDVADALAKLSAHFVKETESAVRVKILSMLGDIGNEHNSDKATVASIIDEIIVLMKNETSHKVIAQGMNSLLRLSVYVKDSNGTRIKSILEMARENLKDISHRVMCKCLQVIGMLTPPCTGDELNELIHLIECYFNHDDARVRAQAVSTMIQLHERGFATGTSIYANACLALKDDYEIVRIRVLDLLWVLGNAYPESRIILPDSEQGIRLVDDAFVKICNSVNDLSLYVRQHAAKLLGSMKYVSSKFLNQTLDKKLMSDMRRKRTAHELAFENLTSGEWASGKKWADDKPREYIKADAINLMSSGACGAFVHGLEDEFLEVRSASVESLCQLSLNNTEFANLCLDFLVDMFNDEIEDVRIKAIDALRQISQHITLRDDQLDTILGALEDRSLEVREGLHRMLASCTMSTTTGLKMCVEKLMDNLKKYPQDRRSTYNCLKNVGGRHPALVLPLVPQFLCMHPFFDMAECDVDNPNYICILILVLNAAKNSDTIAPLLEPQTLKHYSYLRDTMPGLVPELCLPNETGITLSRLATVPESLDFLNNIITHLNREMNTTHVQITLFQSAKEHLERLSKMDQNVAGTAEFTSLYIGAQLLMVQLLQKNFWNSFNLAAQETNTLKSKLDQLLLNCMKLQHFFTGLSPNEHLAVKQLKLRALGMYLVYIVKDSTVSALAPCHHFLSAVEDMQKELDAAIGFETDAFVRLLFKELASVEEPKPGTVARILMPILRDTKLGRTPLSNINIRMTSVQIIEPSGQSDSTLKFTAGLIMSVPFEAELMNVLDASRVRLIVKYPDQKIQVILPRPGHMKSLNFDDSEEMQRQNIRLLTSVLISHQVWSEACNVEINIALAVPDGDIAKRKQTHDSNQFMIDLCKPVKVSVSPKPIKRAL